jgi:hypothetical protein
MEVNFLRSVIENHYKNFLPKEDDVPVDIHIFDDLMFRKAVDNGDMESVKHLIKFGANIHAKNDESIGWASYEGHLEMVKFLYDIGLNIHERDDFALRWAASKGHIEILEFLLDKGADISAKNYKALRWVECNLYESDVFFVPSSNSSINSSYEIVKYFLYKGSPVSILRKETVDRINQEINMYKKIFIILEEYFNKGPSCNIIEILDTYIYEKIIKEL